METSNQAIATRSRGPVQNIDDSATSTPMASQTDDRRHDGQFVMPETPEQLEELFSRRLAAVASEATARTPLRNYDTGHSGSSNDPSDLLRPRALPPQEVPSTCYRNTTSVSCDTLRANKLIENNNENFKKKELILKVLKTEDLLTLVNGKRKKPFPTTDNPSGYSVRRMIVDEDGEQIISADDIYLFSHDTARLYMAINIATSDNLQFLFPEATSIGDGVTLWNLIIAKIFGTTYKDLLEASDRLRRWTIDPSKHVQSDLHNLSILVQRVNETSKSDMPESSILAIIYEALSRDPREELRMIATYSSWNKQSLNELIHALHDSHSAQPYNNKNVKMHELKSVNTGYCNKFQLGKCSFGDKCRYKHEIDPEFKNNEVIIDGKKAKDNIKDKSKKILPMKNAKRNFNTNNYHNKIAGPPRGKQVEGQPPRYSNQQVVTIRNFIKTNGISEEPSNTISNNVSWLFKSNNVDPTNNVIDQRMYVLKKQRDTVTYPDTNDCNNSFDLKATFDDSNMIFKSNKLEEMRKRAINMRNEYLENTITPAVDRLYGLPPARQNFSTEFNKFMKMEYNNAIGTNDPYIAPPNNANLSGRYPKQHDTTPTRFSTPPKRRRINSLIAQHVRMLTVSQQPSLQILDSGAGISGVGEQWKMTDICQASEFTIQGAFGDPMKPSVQGLLGPDKLPAVLVPGMKDDIYSLCQILQPNHKTGTPSRIAIFTENGAIIMTSESCQSIIEKAIMQGSQTHIADQVGGIYVLRKTLTHVATLSSSTTLTSADHLDGLYAGYSRSGLN